VCISKHISFINSQRKSKLITAIITIPRALDVPRPVAPAVTGGGVAVTAGLVTVGVVGAAVVGMLGTLGMGAGVIVEAGTEVGSTRRPVSVGTA